MFSRYVVKVQLQQLISIGSRKILKKFYMAATSVSSTKTKVVAQVVGIDTGDSSPSIIVATDTSRYLFDAGEGLQRFCGEHRTRLVKVDALFVSQISAMRAGGLPGLLLTLADMGKKGVAVYGPRGLHDFAFALRHFLRREDFSLNANEFYTQSEAAGPRAVRMPVITRPDLLVTPILLVTGGKSRSERDRAVDAQVKRFPPGLGRRPFEEALSSPILTPSAIFDNEKCGPKSLVTLSSPFQPLTLQSIGCSETKVLPSPISHLVPFEDVRFDDEYDLQTRDSAACYICSTFPVAGRFHPEKAKALGVPVGPLFGDLMRGLTIELANTGARVTPLEVKDPDAPGQLFAIICCPTVEFLPALLNSKEAFSQFFEESESGASKSKFLVVFHQTPANVASTPEYVQWMRRCGPLTKHIMLDHVPSSGLKSIGLPTMFFDQAVQQCKLNILRPGTFSLPQPLPAVAEKLVSTMRMKGDCDEDLSDLQNIAKLKLFEASSASHQLPEAADSETNRSSTIIDSLESHETDILGFSVINAPPLLSYNIVPLASQGLQLTCSLNSINGNISKTSNIRRIISVKPLLPWLGVVRPDLAIQSMIDDPAMLPHLQKALLRGKSSIKKDIPESFSVPSDAEIIFTGTSSAVPNKYRNVTGIFVRMPQSAVQDSIHERSALFLDCGEGSYGSLVRRLGRERLRATALENGGLGCVDDAVACISFVWISHMHADHHLGTLRLIVERSKARSRLSLPEIPILIVGPTRMYFWLLEMSRIDKELAGQWRFADAEYFACIPSIVSPMDSDSLDTDPATLTSETGKRARSPSREKSLTWQSPPGFAQCSVDDEKVSDGRTFSEYSSTTNPQSDLREAPRSSRRPATHLVQMPQEYSNVSTSHLTADHLADHAFCERVAAGLGLTGIRAVRVRHCHKAYGIRLEIVSKSYKEDLDGTKSTPSLSPHSWSLVYSGDTRPCSELVALGLGGSHVTDLIQHHSAGQAPSFNKFKTVRPEQRDALLAASEAASSGCSILIHEATFEDDEDGCANAITKRHSTAGQACEIAHEMGAQHTLLTHFSARYPKLPVLKVAGSSQSNLSNGDPVADSAAAAAEVAELAGRTLFVAYDLMRVTGRDLSQLPSLLPALHTLFAEDANLAEDEL